MGGTSRAKTGEGKLGSASYASRTGYRDGRRGVSGLKVLCSSKSRQLQAPDLNLQEPISCRRPSHDRIAAGQVLLFGLGKRFGEGSDREPWHRKVLIERALQ